MSLVSSSAGALVRQQEYDPWGKVRLLVVQSPPYGSGQAPIQETRGSVK